MNDTSAPDLPRKLGSFPATNLVVANMIGAGIFTTSGLLMQELGNPMAMMALWVAGGVLALCGALCFGALGAAMPRASSCQSSTSPLSSERTRRPLPSGMKRAER